jgi:probable F420-dependent oxidoreductase
MKFGIGLPNSVHVVAMTQPWEHALSGADIVHAARVADELGYWKLLTGEHFIIPKSHVPLSGDHYLHSVAALSFVATAAPRMRLSSSVTILPLQNPIVQAKAWATLDWLSGGRAIALVGVGWLEEEYRILRVPFHERGRLCDEYIAAMIALWTSDSPAFEGEYVSFKDVGFAPKPVQKPHVPLWFGGDADNVLKRVARAHAVTGDARAQGSWDAQMTIDQCNWLKGLGVTEVVAPLPPLQDFEAYLDHLRWVAAEVMPKVD